jgi:hypothetical protein
MGWQQVYMTKIKATPQEIINKRLKFLELKVAKRVLELIKDNAVTLGDYSGVNNSRQNEIVPNYSQTNNETVYPGKTNAFIILGSDRNAGVASGYGGVSETGCATIDLVAGLQGCRPVSSINGVEVPAQKSFEYDAARVYISQKCDLDDYLGLPSTDLVFGDVTLPVQKSVGKSGVALKADCIRVVARDNIVIATTNLGALASGQEVSPNGIDIIAGAHFANDLKTNLQPMVKGNNLAAALEDLINQINEIQEQITVLKETQQEFNSILQGHRHNLSNTFMTDAPLSQEKLADLNSQIANLTSDHIIKHIDLQAWKLKYLSVASLNYINSLYNRVN